MSGTCNILGIVGSLRRESYNRSAMRAAHEFTVERALMMRLAQLPAPCTPLAHAVATLGAAIGFSTGAAVAQDKSVTIVLSEELDLVELAGRGRGDPPPSGRRGRSVRRRR